MLGGARPCTIICFALIHRHRRRHHHPFITSRGEGGGREAQLAHA